MLLAIGTAIFLFFFSIPHIKDLSEQPKTIDKRESEVPLPRVEEKNFSEASPPKEISKVVPPMRIEYIPPPPSSSTTTTANPALAGKGGVKEAEPVKEVSLPSLKEEQIFKAVVKIECPTKDGLGKYIGSGFVLSEEVVVTAAHVVNESGNRECTIIFPSERKPIHYLKGVIRDFEKLKERLDERGIDFALLDLPPLSSYPEARAIFSSYPLVPYSFCEDPKMLGDATYHYGYPANFKDLEYLERLKGEALEYADIEGTEMKGSEDGASYKAPIFSFNVDESRLHPYMISRTGVFYGASGGLAFNATKQCILGPHHGFSAGSSESFSIFMILGWEKIKTFLE